MIILDRKVLKEKLAAEIKTYFERINPQSKYATFEVADFDAMLNDILKVFEEHYNEPKEA